MGKEDRKKATDIFQETDYLFVEKTTFEKAFPSIADIQIEVIEEGEDASEWRKNRYYNKTNAGEYVDCSNRRCYNGGFCLGRIIRYMISNNLTNYETSEYCQGYEGSPKGRKKYDNCYNSFEVKVEIKYK